jgi:hypothetical protein
MIPCGTGRRLRLAASSAANPANVTEGRLSEDQEEDEGNGKEEPEHAQQDGDEEPEQEPDQGDEKGHDGRDMHELVLQVMARKQLAKPALDAAVMGAHRR